MYGSSTPAPTTPRARPRSDHGLGLLVRAGTAVLAMLVLVAGSACVGEYKRRWEVRSPDENYRLAVEAENADERRDAIVRIGESSYVTSEEAFHVLDAAARTDPVTQIRCIAIRAFARYNDDRPVPTVLAILEAEEGSNEMLPLTDHISWDAASTLLALERKGVLEAEQRERARRIFIRLLDPGQPRAVRVVATEALGHYQHQDVFQPLIRQLRNEDFGIAERSQYALVQLTGVTHDYDAEAWESWLNEADDPFEHAGRTPRNHRPSGPSWLEQQQRAFQRAIKLRSD